MTQEEFIRALFGHTENNVHFESLGNERDGPHPRRILDTRDLQSLGDFHRQWDKPGRGLFFCVGTLKPGTDRRKENVAEIAALHSDMDFKDIADLPDVILRKLREWQRMPPSIIVRSGNGYHGYWLLTEATTDFDRIEAVLRLLADITGGDPSVCEISRLMRLPGSHNSKGGQWKKVEIVLFEPERRYELHDLEDILAETSPIIQRKPKEGPVTRVNGSNPFLEAAREGGFKPPLDVEQLLAEMTVGNIHETQIRVAASMLENKHTVDDVVAILLPATKAAAGDAGRNWNWQKEERNIRKSCDTWLSKHPQAAPAPKAAVSAGSGTVVNLADARRQKAEQKAKDAPKSGKEKVDIAALVAEGVIKAIRQAGRDILLTEGDVWIYADGCWHVMTGAEDQWLKSMIQSGFTTLSEHTKMGNLTAAYKRLMEHPDLFREAVPWADGDMVVCQNGVLRISDGAFSAHEPAHYARHKIGAPYVVGAACPLFLALLDSMFVDRGPEAPAYVRLLQNFAGAALAISKLTREERKALILLGASRTGKTELAKILALLIGEPIAAPSVEEISGRFGLQILYGKRAWIRDDAINEGDKLDPQKFKTVVTGERVSIERKYQDSVMVELNIPVILTTNSLPRARDKSDAIFNRSLIIEMNSVVSEAEAKTLRQKYGVPRGYSIGDYIFEQEAAGILQWALAGLADLLQRGSFELPASVQAVIDRFRDDNNPVHEWSRTAIKRDDNTRVSKHDLLCAYHGWQRDQDGDEARALGMRYFLKDLRSAAPYAREMQANDGKRYVENVSLTQEGLLQWESHRLAPLKGGAHGTSDTKLQINRPHVKTHFPQHEGS